MRLLVTGGCGFIGSNFIRHILQKYENYKITNLDALTYAGNSDNLKDIEKNPNYNFVKDDITNYDILHDLIKDTDIILNFAAESHVDRSISNADPFLKTNIMGTHTLLKLALKFNKKLVHISTDEVYGSIEHGSFTEDSNLKPNSPYSASKASGDLLCRAYHETHGTDITIIRSTNNFGPFQYPEKIMPLFITNLLENKKVPIYGNGKNVRDWLYVLDNCEAIDLVVHKGKKGEIYNVSSNNELSNIELTKNLIKILGKEESFIEYVEDRKGHDKRFSTGSERT